MDTKEKQWKGYFSNYIKWAKKKGIDPLEILDREWSDGYDTAKREVCPFINEKSVVLEIASGIGRVSRFVAPKCKELYCTDILEEAITELKKNLNKFSNVHYNKINGYDLREFDENFFDCVISFTTFFHFDFELVLNYFREIKRVLKPGGTRIVEFKQWKDEKDLLQLLNKIEDQDGINIYETQLDKWRYVSADMLKIICDYYEFEIINDDVTVYTFRKI